jgi:hypothetical protein
MESGKAYAEFGEAIKQFTKFKFQSCLKVQIRIKKITFALAKIFSFDYFEKLYLKYR